MKKTVFFLAAAIFASPLWGEPIGENVAHRVANQVLLQSSATLRSANDTQKTLQLLYKSSSSNIDDDANATLRSASADETVYFYVFGGEDNKGFVIVSGDDRVTPVLGYSDTNGFSADDMPNNLKWWLGEYARQIQFAIDNDITPTQRVSQQWAQYLGTNNNGKEEQK
ncbi:hypothetical protein AGMMS49965_18280 [Bacteroidia bacterium]|nr:hypothetical protein AGMMS49965_18280 [Bacteroidia bacterium]